MSNRYSPLACCDRDCAAANNCGGEGGAQCERCGCWYCPAEEGREVCGGFYCDRCADEVEAEEEEEEETDNENEEDN